MFKKIQNLQAPQIQPTAAATVAIVLKLPMGNNSEPWHWGTQLFKWNQDSPKEGDLWCVTAH